MVGRLYNYDWAVNIYNITIPISEITLIFSIVTELFNKY